MISLVLHIKNRKVSGYCHICTHFPIFILKMQECPIIHKNPIHSPLLKCNSSGYLPTHNRPKGYSQWLQWDPHLTIIQNQHLRVKLLVLQIFLSLGFKSTVPKRIHKWQFQCMFEKYSLKFYILTQYGPFLKFRDSSSSHFKGSNFH